MAVAASLLSGSSCSVRSMRDVTLAKSSAPYGHAAQNAASATAALASMSSPVSATDTWLRWPASSFMATFSVSGGASPRTPLMRTRSGPTSSRVMVSKRAVTSGPR